MKKHFNLFLALIIGLLLTSCGKTTSSSKAQVSSSSAPSSFNLCLLSINDLHGAIESDSGAGISRIETLVNRYRNLNDNRVVLLNAGDAFQGTGISNLTKGRAVIETMNEMDFDQMTIGNHEFDWGIEEIAKYFDGDESNGEANFPIGSANIYSKDKNELFSWVDEYTIVEKGGLKIGIIPTIGYNLESSILATRVSNYTFKEPLEIIENLAKKLRSEDKCDIIIVNSHDDGSYINERIADFQSDSRVDAVINGHSHYRNEELFIRGEDTKAARLATVQAGCNGEYLGVITLKIKDKVVIGSESDVITISSSTDTNFNVEKVVLEYKQKVQPILNQSLATMGESVTREDQLYTWAGEVIQKSLDCDVGITNKGGIRSSGSLVNGQSITYRQLYEIMPFDNAIMKTTIKGSILKQYLYQNEGGLIIAYRSGLSSNSIEDNTDYSIGVIDYVAEKSYSESLRNSTYQNSNYVFRDLLEEDIRKAASENGNFRPSIGAVITKEDLK